MIKWSKEKVKEDIIILYKKYDKISDSYVRKHHPLLRAAAVRYFKNWSLALEECGININNIKIRKSWSKGELINNIIEISKNNILTLSYIKEYHLDIYKASVRRFGSWKNTIETIFGINYNEIRSNNSWTKEKVISEILDANNLSYSSVSNDLYKAALRYFGSWEKAINYAGLNYKNIKLVSCWNKEKVISFINNRGCCLSITEMINDGYGKVVAAGSRYFGSWKNAIEESGLDYSSVIRPTMGCPSTGIDGFLYDSILEKTIANYLYSSKESKLILSYIPHVKFCSHRKWTCDFKITKNNGKNLWMEVDGLKDSRPCSDALKEKLYFYNKNNMDYVIVYSLSDVLEVLCQVN